jgi:hypothetical protein
MPWHNSGLVFDKVTSYLAIIVVVLIKLKELLLCKYKI